METTSRSDDTTAMHIGYIQRRSYICMSVAYIGFLRIAIYCVDDEKEEGVMGSPFISFDYVATSRIALLSTSLYIYPVYLMGP